MGERFQIQYTQRAKRHLQKKVEYIYFDLQAPAVAERWITRLYTEMENVLPQFPFLYPLSSLEPLRRRGVRQFTFRNDVILYTVDEARKTVVIEAVINKGRDISRLLHEEE